MNENEELLNFIYKNSEMGVSTLGKLIDMVGEISFRKQLTDQLAEYRTFENSAKELISKYGAAEKGLSDVDKAKTYFTISMQTMTDKSNSHIAEMLITGSNMGIIESVKNLKKYPAAEKEVRDLLQRLLEFEENNVQRLKEFL